MPLSHFHPIVQRWFRERVGTPSPPQVEGWPRIRSGRHTLIAAPTGTGKTFAAFLWAIDELLRRGKANGVVLQSITEAEAREAMALMHRLVAPLAAADKQVGERMLAGSR